MTMAEQILNRRTNILNECTGKKKHSWGMSLHKNTFAEDFYNLSIVTDGRSRSEECPVQAILSSKTKESKFLDAAFASNQSDDI